jgi:hypothetical protein
MAYGLLDVADFLRGVRGVGFDDADEASVAASELIEWRGGGPDVWGGEE